MKQRRSPPLPEDPSMALHALKQQHQHRQKTEKTEELEAEEDKKNVNMNRSRNTNKNKNEKKEEKGTVFGCHPPLVDYHSLPPYLKDNEYILSHYRADFSLKHAFCSLFSWHNETLNIWSHLVGFIIFLGFTILAVSELPKADLPTNATMCMKESSMHNSINNSEPCLLKTVTSDAGRMGLRPAERWPFFVFLGGSMFCLLASTVCHLLSCHSQALSVFLMRVDYAGIATMITTSFFPPIYYVFQCTPIWQFIYLGAISVMGVAAFAVLFAPVCQTGKYRAFRALLFLCMGVSGIIPAVHSVVIHLHEPFCLTALAHEAVMGLLYGFGALLYSIRIPERWRPGVFDLVGHSHNLFHLLVIAGAYTHYKAAIILLEWRDNTACASS